MKNLLQLHAIARNGDGLTAGLLDLIARRTEIASDPRIVELKRYRSSIVAQAGPDPAGAQRRGRAPLREIR